MKDNVREHSLRKANPNTIHDKFIVGYQGWFTCPDDGVPIHAGHHGWLHWLDKPISDGGHPTIDFWPDVSAYSTSELFPVHGLTLPDGQPARVFSSRHPRTVQRHFHWMAEHGVDGCFLHRPLSRIGTGTMVDFMRLRDEIGDRVKEAAEKEGRVFAIMYDICDTPGNRLQSILEFDWNHLVHRRAVLDSPSYLREKGRPVVAICGVGLAKNSHDPAVLRQIIRNVRKMTPGGAYIIAGTPTHWQTLEGDADKNPEFLDVYLNEFDAISPWSIGRYRDLIGADRFADHKIQDDMKVIQRHCEGRNVDYIPVVWPGISEYHSSNEQREPNHVPRDGGKLLWRQIVNAKSKGARIIFGATWDGYDNGTAMMPIEPYKVNLPREAKFLALDADRYDLPPDWYMRICGLATEALRGERMIHDTFPKKELDDYWSSRPKYDTKSADAAASSSSQNVASSSEAASASTSQYRSDSNAGGPATEPLDADQGLENDEAPPPYTLESTEPSNPIPEQRVQAPQQPVSAGTNSPASPPCLLASQANHSVSNSQQSTPGPQSGSTGSLSSNIPGNSRLPSSSQDHAMPSASAVTSPTTSGVVSQGNPSTNETVSGGQSVQPSESPENSFVGGWGFLMGPSANVQPPKPIPEGSFSSVGGFYVQGQTSQHSPTHAQGHQSSIPSTHHHNYNTSSPTTHHQSSVPPTHHQSSIPPTHHQSSTPPTLHQGHHASVPPAQPQAVYNSPAPVPTHTPHSFTAPGPAPSQFPPADWQMQNPYYQPSHAYPSSHSQYSYQQPHVPPPQHPSAVSHNVASSSGQYSAPYNIPPQNQPTNYGYGQYPQQSPTGQHAQPHQGQYGYPQPHPSSHTQGPQRPEALNTAWQMVDMVAGSRRRQKLEQGVDSLVNQIMKL